MKSDTVFPAELWGIDDATVKRIDEIQQSGLIQRYNKLIIGLWDNYSISPENIHTFKERDL